MTPSRYEINLILSHKIRHENYWIKIWKKNDIKVFTANDFETRTPINTLGPIWNTHHLTDLNILQFSDNVLALTSHTLTQCFASLPMHIFVSPPWWKSISYISHVIYNIPTRLTVRKAQHKTYTFNLIVNIYMQLHPKHTAPTRHAV